MEVIICAMLGFSIAVGLSLGWIFWSIAEGIRRDL